MIEFEIAGQKYRAGKLDAFKQFHVSRKISPLLPALVPVFLRVTKNGGVSKDLSGVAELLTPFADGLAGMTDETAEYIISTCLSVIQRKNGDVWAPVWSLSGKCCMFDDVDMGVMIPLIVRVIQDSLGPFIQGMLTSQQSIPEESPAP